MKVLRLGIIYVVLFLGLFLLLPCFYSSIQSSIKILLIILTVFLSLLLHEFIHLIIFLTYGISVEVFNVSLVKIRFEEAGKNIKIELNNFDFNTVFGGSIVYSIPYYNETTKKRYLHGLMKSYLYAPMGSLIISLLSMLLWFRFSHLVYNDIMRYLSFALVFISVFNFFIFLTSLYSSDNYEGDIRVYASLKDKKDF